MNKTVVIMTSGGLDSFIAHFWAIKHGYQPLHVYVNLGQPYADKEEKAIDKFGFSVRKITCDVLKAEYDNVPTVDSWIIPARNLLLSTIGAMFGGNVWIQALDGEMHKYAKERDKSPEFFHLSSGLLTYVCDIVRPETIVTTPFKNMTKTEIVRWALNNGLSKKDLTNTSSCYDGEKGNCGKCGTCFKRWVAMSNNNIQEEYETTPWQNDYAKNSWEGIQKAIKTGDYSHYSKKRCHETDLAMRRVL